MRKSGKPDLRGARALRYGAQVVPGALRRTPQRALQGRVCETRPEARAGGDLEACEASPPNRCASRRSTADRVVGGRSRLAAKRLMMAPPLRARMRHPKL